MDIRHALLQRLHPVLKRVTRWYLSRERVYHYEGLRIQVFPGVFHPGLFFSTGVLLRFLKDQSLAGKTLLELGSGSGLIAVWSARQGAFVTASDINSQAIHNTRENAKANGVPVAVVHSDLFTNMPAATFDWIVVNPPYYPRQPANEAENAWYCGENFEYFGRFFAQLHPFLHSDSSVLMVLSEDCALNRITNMATQHGFAMNQVRQEKTGGEWNYIYQITYEHGV
jgi:release factor glutamine methyltransferase